MPVNAATTMSFAKFRMQVPPDDCAVPLYRARPCFTRSRPAF
jgi:hypothetical protein